ncbi:MAG: ABC transporter substrate-binding protein, partial [Acidobacteria bacterium]|nr:ABC transporter substrate-binding protein [Acidobacteriota bacterium]
MSTEEGSPVEDAGSPGGIAAGRGTPARGNALRRWGPFTAILLALALFVGLVARGGGESVAVDDTLPESGLMADPANVELPNGVLPFEVAEARGEVGDIDWGLRCDVETGRLRLPLSPPPSCFAPFEGDNGGATSTGVTADTIKVVVYTPQLNDPLLSFIYAQIGNDDTPQKVFDTYVGFNEIMARYYETYGRRVELIKYEATGSSADAVAAAADAETIARDIQPFAVLGGPNLTGAFAETLAANQVLCISCAPGQTAEWFEERGPYVWDIGKNIDQNIQMTAEYVTKRLAGGNAVYGGPEVVDQPRVFGRVFLEGLNASQEPSERFRALLGEGGVEFTEEASYADPVSLGGNAREIMARFKAAGVTTILFAGDPLAPQALTQAATAQDYFPEWVITGSSLTDTTIFGRTYDQAQWEHAFGPSNLFARVSPTVAGSGYLYRWYFDGAEPPAQQSALILPSLQLLYGVLQGAGTDLSPEMFRRVIFASEIIPGSVIAPQISWGERGIWPGVDYAGLDDQTEVWWDPSATGEDEIGNDGAGMWTYADGGRRYLPGGWPDSP